MASVTSAVLCFKQPTAALVLQAAALIRLRAQPVRLEVVRLPSAVALVAQGGELAWLASQEGLSPLTRVLSRALWSGVTAVGQKPGQVALAIDAKGKTRYRSEWAFDYPARVRKVAFHPFSAPEVAEALLHRHRAAHGYGRIGKDLKADLSELFIEESGLPFPGVPTLALEATSKPAELTRWLKARTPRPPRVPTPDRVVVTLLDTEEADTQRAGLIVLGSTRELARRRRLASPSYVAQELGAHTVIALQGGDLARLAPTLLRHAFAAFLAEFIGTGVIVASVRKGELLELQGQFATEADALEARDFVVPAVKGEAAEIPAMPQHLATLRGFADDFAVLE
jgi:hypothetical protein